MLAGPAGNAISRLLGAAVDIPAAYLRGFSQRADDQTEARSYISQQIAKRAAERAVEDPKIMDRAMNNMLLRSYRVQENKDEIAAITIEDLQAEPPSSSSPGPSDDWMMKFERYAEDATSKDLRMMFAKLLAGEIRKPGTISPATLHFASMLDAETARLIERALTVYALDAACVIGFLSPKMTISEIVTLEQSGFWTPEKQFTIKCGSNGIFGFGVGVDGKMVAVKGTPNKEIRFETAIVSRAGKDLAKIVNKEFDMAAFSKSLKQHEDIKEVYYGKAPPGDNFSLSDLNIYSISG